MFKRWLARRRLAKLVERNRNSFRIQDYSRRRLAALKGLGRA